MPISIPKWSDFSLTSSQAGRLQAFPFQSQNGLILVLAYGPNKEIVDTFQSQNGLILVNSHYAKTPTPIPFQSQNGLILVQ